MTNEETVNTDITYCNNVNCPLTHCERHHSLLQNKQGLVSIADFGSTCVDYKIYLAERYGG